MVCAGFKLELPEAVKTELKQEQAAAKKSEVKQESGSGTSSAQGQVDEIDPTLNESDEGNGAVIVPEHVSRRKGK